MKPPDIDFIWPIFPHITLGMGMRLTSTLSETGSDICYCDAGYISAWCCDRQQIRMSSPLREHTGLFRTFSAVDPNEPNEIKTFAEHHGPLGYQTARVSGCQVTSVQGEQPTHKPLPVEFRENVTIWGQEIDNMKNLVHLWDAIMELDTDGMSLFIDEIAKKEKITNRFSSVRPDLTGPQHIMWSGLSLDNEQHTGLTMSDAIAQATVFLQACINRHLTAHTHSTLYHRKTSRSSLNSLRLSMTPKSLLGAMWLQFASAIVRNARFRDCAHCGASFEVEELTNKSSRRVGPRFCSCECDAAAYREKFIRTHFRAT